MRSVQLEGDRMVSECPHDRSIIRKYRASNGVISYRMQCQECGTA